MQGRLSDYFLNLLSKFQYGFLWGFSAQQCLLVLVGKLRKMRILLFRMFVAVLADLWKVFDCTPHDLLLTEWRSFCFGKNSFAFISAYLKNRKREPRFGQFLVFLLNILFSVRQGSILGPLLFTISITDIFYINYNLDYASDTTPYHCRFNFPKTIDFLEPNIQKNRFQQNRLTANSGKSHFLLALTKK